MKEQDDPATTELLQALDELYPLPDDDKRVERSGRTCYVLKRWMDVRTDELQTIIPKLMKRFAPALSPPEAQGSRNSHAVKLAELLAVHRDGQDGSNCCDINDPGSCETCATLDGAIKALSAHLESQGTATYQKIGESLGLSENILCVPELHGTASARDQARDQTIYSNGFRAGWQAARPKEDVTASAAGSVPVAQVGKMTVTVDDVGDHVCQHGTALDVHCCNCHSGFIFDIDHECPSEPMESDDV